MTKETTFTRGGGGGVRWQQQRSTAFDGVGGGIRREDERTAQGQAKQQPSSMMIGREGGVCVCVCVFWLPVPGVVL